MLEIKNENTLPVAGTTNNVFSQGGVVSSGHNFHTHYTIHCSDFASQRHCINCQKKRRLYGEQS